MLKDLLFDVTQIPLLKKGMDAYAMRQRALADNVANAETPGYNRRTVKFEEKLEEARQHRGLARTHTGHLHQVAERLNLLKPEIEVDRSVPEDGEINNVDIDREMSELARNNLQFNFAAQMTRMYLANLNSAIKGI